MTAAAASMSFGDALATNAAFRSNGPRFQHSSAQTSFSKTAADGGVLWSRSALAEFGNAGSRALSCTADISQIEATVRPSAGDSFAGLTTHQSVDAQLHRKPAPESVQRADRRLKAQFPRL
jgi:hypothetical protein